MPYASLSQVRFVRQGLSRPYTAVWKLFYAIWVYVISDYRKHRLRGCMTWADFCGWLALGLFPCHKLSTKDPKMRVLLEMQPRPGNSVLPQFRTFIPERIGFMLMPGSPGSYMGEKPLAR